MHREIGGWLWGFIDIVLVMGLGGALAYASLMWRRWRRHPTQSDERDRKTRELFGRR